MSQDARLVAVTLVTLGAAVAGLLVWLAARRQKRRIAQLSSAADALRQRMQKAFDDEALERAGLESVLEAMPDGVLVVDSNGIVHFANEAAMAILGATSPGVPRGKRLIEVTRANDVYELAMGAANQGRVGMREIELLPERRFVTIMGLPMASGSDHRSERRVVVIIKDVTELHRVEVTRREFVSNASHELRTPVAAIKASAETLQAGAVEDPGSRDDFLARIIEDADRMDRMLNELLLLSRLESGQIPLHMAPVDLAVFAEDVASRFGPIAAARGISLRWTVNKPVPLVTADIDKLHQLFGNLIGNALKATPSGGSISLNVERADRFVEMQVIDTGKGIEPQHLPHIFERFYKADRARSDDGAGLGLAIAKHIAIAHQGDIAVRSRTGEGSTFTVRLPVPVGFESA